MMEWNGIDSAPKNPEGEFFGPWIIVWCEYDHGEYEVRWQYDNIGRGFWKGKGASDFSGYSDIKHITHWKHKSENPNNREVL